MPRSFTRQCPQCTKQVTWPDTATYPFCSERCRLIDLGVWAEGDYRLPGEPVVDDEIGSEYTLGADEDEAC
jgi:endogenous inhibitor of DNA gyrase (YacG/DUF329 family)